MPEGQVTRESVVEGDKPMPLRMTDGATVGYECKAGTHEIAGEGPFTCLACGARFEDGGAAKAPWERS